jgi:hypothetical protein
MVVILSESAAADESKDLHFVSAPCLKVETWGTSSRWLSLIQSNRVKLAR